MQLQVDDHVSYTDQYGERRGRVIEICEVDQRARIKWDEKRPRTWIRFSALKILPK